MRLVDRRFAGRVTDDSDALERPRCGVSEKLANGLPPPGLTTPVTVEPLVAMNAVETAGVDVSFTVTTCIPAVAASVQRTDDLPSASLVVVAADTVPPPFAVQVRPLLAT